MKSETLQRLKDLCSIAADVECEKVTVHGGLNLTSIHANGSVRQWACVEEVQKAAHRREREMAK